MKWVRHRCQVARAGWNAIASTRPRCASEITNVTPASPRATRPRRNANQPAPSSVVITSKPRISRWPSALTPAAMTTATLTIRPVSRTFWVIASNDTYV